MKEVGEQKYEYKPLGQYIVRAAGVCGGKPTFKNTRIEVAGVLDRVATGESVESIAAGFGGRVPREAVLEAAKWNAEYKPSPLEREPLTADEVRADLEWANGRRFSS